MTTPGDTGETYSDGIDFEEQDRGSSSDQPIGRVASASGRLLSQAIVFAALVLSGVTTFAIVAFAEVDWFYPTLVYAFALYVAWLKFYAGSREVVDDTDIDDSVNARLQVLEGRLLTMSGYVLGEASMKPGSSLEAYDRDRLEKAISLSQRGYDILKEVGGPAKYTALNNLVFYSAVLNDKSRAAYLLSVARELLEKGQEHSANNLLLTACRVILQFSENENERAHAFQILRSLLDAGRTSNRERKEAELCLEYFSPKLSKSAPNHGLNRTDPAPSRGPAG